MLHTQQFSINPGAAVSFGAGAMSELPDAVASLGLDRALIVTDPGVARSGASEEAERLLTSRGIETSTFADVRPNPDVPQIDEGASIVRSFGRAAIVAIGGGSVLDVAKVYALMATNTGSARDFDFRNEPVNFGLPVIALPTTAGTGSETNGWAVLEDPETRRKFYAAHRSVAPRVVILDPELSRGLPPAPTAASGVDVLSHALESLCSLRPNPYAEALALQCVRMTYRYLPRAVADGQDLEARSRMLLAAHMAGLAFATTGLGLDHAVGHALSAHLGTPHGMALAVMLPAVLSFNLPVREKVYIQLAEAIGVGGGQAPTNTPARVALDAIEALLRDIGMPSMLRELNCSRELIPGIAADALADVVIDNTPRLPSEPELLELLQGVW